MSYETYYEYDENINLDRESLYDYVVNDNGYIKNAILERFSLSDEKKPVLTDIDTDEENDNSDKNKDYNYLLYFFIIVCVAIFLYFTFIGKLNCGKNVDNSNVTDIMHPMSEDIGPEFRAIFLN
jgi:hypothetical protein